MLEGIFEEDFIARHEVALGVSGFDGLLGSGFFLCCDRFLCLSVAAGTFGSALVTELAGIAGLAALFAGPGAGVLCLGLFLGFCIGGRLPGAAFCAELAGVSGLAALRAGPGRIGLLFRGGLAVFVLLVLLLAVNHVVHLFLHLLLHPVSDGIPDGVLGPLAETLEQVLPLGCTAQAHQNAQEDCYFFHMNVFKYCVQSIR